ncbi:hypothetical protein ABBQ32_003947 [Trebouxia sp. C0010 RCD-2024]
MLPCGDSQPAAGQEEGGPSSAAGPIAAERSNSAFASGDLDLGQQAPNMLVVVLAGFQATSRTTEARVSQFASPGMTPYCRWVLAASSSESGHRAAAATATTAVAATATTADRDMIKAEHMRSNSAMPALSAAKLSTKSSLLPNAAEARQHAAALAATLPRLETAATSRLGAQASTTRPTPDAKSVTGALGRAHTVAAMDQTKLQEASGSGLQPVSSSGDALATDQSNSSAWRKQRPGATFFKKLQVHVQVQAFLTLPDLTADGGGLDDRCQVIQPFSVETAVDHCVEPTSSGNYRRAPPQFCPSHPLRVVQVHLSTSDVDIELSQYIKRELHSLHNYLLTSFSSQDIAAFSKHFAKEGKAAPQSRTQMGRPLHNGSGLAEGIRSTLRRNAGSHPDLTHSGGSGAAAMLADAADQPDKARQSAALSACT